MTEQEIKAELRLIRTHVLGLNLNRKKNWAEMRSLQKRTAYLKRLLYSYRQLHQPNVNR